MEILEYNFSKDKLTTYVQITVFSEKLLIFSSQVPSPPLNKIYLLPLRCFINNKLFATKPNVPSN